MTYHPKHLVDERSAAQVRVDEYWEGKQDGASKLAYVGRHHTQAYYRGYQVSSKSWFGVRTGAIWGQVRSNYSSHFD